MSQKMEFFITTDVRISNPTCVELFPFVGPESFLKHLNMECNVLNNYKLVTLDGT
jgi:hypothetical protein